MIAAWREGFGSFWPKGNDFYPPLTGLDPGEVALLSAAGPARMKFKTGVMVLYADEVSFTLMTPEGHMFAGWITFSAFEDGDDGRRAGAGADARAGPDRRARPHVRRARQGEHVLGADAGRRWPRRSACRGAVVSTQVVCVDRKRQWSRAKNVRHSVAIRSTLHMMKPGKR